MKPLFWAMCLCLLGAKPQAASGADEPKPRLDPGAAADVQDVVFYGKARPVMIRMHLVIDGKPFSQGWDNFVEKLFKFCDRNGDGSLDKDEIKRLPPAAMMQQLIRGNFYGFYNVPVVNLNQIDANADDKVTLEEVKTYYAEKAQVAALQIVSGTGSVNQGVTGGNRVTTGLLKYLGAKDGKLDLSKLAREKADEMVSRLDANDDETLDANELTVGLAQQAFGGVPGGVGMMPARPGRGGITLGESSFALIPKERGYDRLTERLGMSKEMIKRYDKDQSGKLTRDEIGLDEEAFKRLDRNSDGVLDSVELLRYFVVAPDVELTAALGKRDTGKPAIQVTPGSKSSLASKVNQASLETLMLSLSTVQMELRSAGTTGQVYVQPAAQRVQYFNQIFTLADKAKKGFVDMQDDLKNPQVQYMKSLFELCDRDADGRVTKKEFEETLQVQSEAFGTTMTLTVNETSKGLFELLDTNRDGRLSVRELRRGKEALAEYDLNRDGLLAEGEIPVQVSLTVGQGSQAAYVVRQPFNQYGQQPRQASTSGPLWFRKMDRNGDGDVSRREFLGSPEDFKKLDLDGDGYLNREEAEKADAALRAKEVNRR